MDPDTLIRVVEDIEGALGRFRTQLPGLWVRLSNHMDDAEHVQQQAKEAVRECVETAETLGAKIDYSKVVDRLKELRLDLLRDAAERLSEDGAELIENLNRVERKRLAAVEELASSS